MTVASSIVDYCNMGFSEKCLRHGVCFETETFCNIFRRNRRLNNFILLCVRSKHNISEQCLKGVDGYEKESVLMGYSALDGLIGRKKSKGNTGEIINGEKSGSNATLTHKKFSSITLGYFPSVELYEGTTCYSELEAPMPKILEGCFPSRIDANWVDPDWSYHTPDSLDVEHVNPSYPLEEKIDKSTMSPQALALKEETRSSIQVTTEKPCGSALSEDHQAAKSVAEILDNAIKNIPGVTKWQLNLLEHCGFYTLRKLLHHFPRTYVDLQNAGLEIEDGQYFIFVGKVVSSRGIRASASFSYLEVKVACEVANTKSDSDCITNTCANSTKRTLYLHLKRFFRGTRFTYTAFLKRIQENYKEGDTVCVSGKVRAMRSKGHYEMREYNIDVINNEGDSDINTKGKPYPIYPSKKGLNPMLIRDIISRALKTLPVGLDPLPKDVTQEFGLLRLSNAYNGIHQPTNLNEAYLARRRLIFDDFFYLQLGRLFQMLEGLGTNLEKEVLLEKCTKYERNATSAEEWSHLTKEFMKVLPYALTSSQLRATSEIIWDLKRPVPMNRLLQGDVGCGKTIVAFLACMEVIGSGYQAAFMVPTELLAVQHYENLLQLLEKMNMTNRKPSVALLTGSTPGRQAKYTRKGLQTGDIDLVIGTHSLIAEKVQFSALRIAIIDEQHRFGVVQRGLFNSKLYFNKIASQLETTDSRSPENDVLMAPHVLAMSATPIPRSLALTLYGDMSLTQITDIPPGRSPVKTYLIEGDEDGFEKAYQMMLEELELGGKVYLVYPIIKKSEQLPQLRAASADLRTISERFPDYKCGLLHGRMKSNEKDEALRCFRSGETSILLATQVIEVGVDVPDASMMVVMNSERFGLAQLHQIRGRVGRGDRESKCILLTSTTSCLNRLKVLEKSSDGFYLANMDLVLRGPGDLLGRKQSGHLPEFPIARLEVDGNILQEAHLAARNVLTRSHDLEKYPDLKAELSMRQPLCPLGD